MSHIQVRVLFFAAAKERIGCDRLELRLPISSQLSDLKENLWGTYPQLKELDPYVRWALNQQFVEYDTAILSHGDEVALIPPISGG